MEMEQLLKFLAQAYMFGYDEEFVFIIVDLGHKLGTTPWNFADNIKEVKNSFDNLSIDILHFIFFISFFFTFT